MIVSKYKGNPFWSGCVSLLDGYIEETHSHEEAESWDFHHSMYFSIETCERMKNGESAFFCINNGKINEEWRDTISSDIEQQILNQIEIEEITPIQSNDDIFLD